MKFDKKAVVSISTFSLILFSLTLILIGSYFFYDDMQDKVYEKKTRSDLDNANLNLRSDLISLIASNNSSLIYVDKYGLEGVEILLVNKSISSKLWVGANLYYAEVSSLGIEFCDNYSFFPRVKVNFSFDGSCVKLN